MPILIFACLLLPPFLIVFAVLAYGARAGGRLLAGQKRFFEGIHAMGGTPVGPFASVFEHEGRRFYAASKSVGGIRLYGFVLGTGVGAPGWLRVIRRDAVEGFLETAGLASRVRTGDPGFDEAFRVECEDAGFAASFLSSAQSREAVQALFRLGCRTVDLDGGSLSAVWRPFEAEDPSFVREALPVLARLARALPAADAASSDMAAWRGAKRNYTALALLPVLPMVLGFGLLLCAGRPLALSEVWRQSLWFSVPVALAYCVAAGRLLGRRPWFSESLGRVALLSLIALPASGICLELYANSALDRAPAVARTVPILRKWQTHSRSGWTGWLELRSWRPGHSTETLAVADALYARARPGVDSLEVATKPGRFRHEWIVATSLKP